MPKRDTNCQGIRKAMIGINVDHRHWDDMDALARLVIGNGVRTVLKPDDDERMSQWLEVCFTNHLLFLAVIARESVHAFDSYRDAMKYYADLYGDVITYWQIGNEPDSNHVSSWTMDHDELDGLLLAADEMLPSNAYKVGPGLVSGQHNWVDGIDLQLIDALAGHYYSKDTDLDDWLNGYKAYGKPFWVTEYPFIEITGHIKRNCEHGFFFCLSDVMVPGHGILESTPAEIELFKRGVNVPEFVLGFADYAATHSNVGEPLTEEYTQTEYNGHVVRAQLTTNGLLLYHTESNTITFLPKE